jgi:DNA-binding NtrC family response regulator
VAGIGSLHIITGCGLPIPERERAMGGQKILVLEDDAAVAAVYAEVLRAAGHDVVVCESFEAARDELRRRPPDALLTDVRVGEYNGLQLALMFRSASPGGTVVVVSGHDDPVIRQEAARIGAEFMLKPPDFAALAGRFGRPAGPSDWKAHSQATSAGRPKSTRDETSRS